MGLDAINSDALRALAAERNTSPQAAAPSSAREKSQEGATDAVEPVRNRPEPSGVPRRLGVQQQLPPNTRLRVDKESNRIVAQILDENNEVVRQIPPEALLEISSRFNRLEGLLFNRES